MDDARIDRLYDAPLDRFVAERDAYAAELREAGDHAAAAEVHALRKPSVPAWAVNRLVRSELAAVNELAAAAERVRRAQEAVMSGGDPAELREASAAERAAVHALVARAETILAEAGFAPNATRREHIAETLSSLADPDAREAVRSGRLSAALQRVGFGGTAVPASVRARTGEADARDAPERAEMRAEVERLATEADRLEQIAGSAAGDADAAETAAREARARANEARRVAARARKEAERELERLRLLER